jgi:hypothetical protein
MRSHGLPALVQLEHGLKTPVEIAPVLGFQELPHPAHGLREAFRIDGFREVVQGVQAFNMAVPILADEIAKLSTANRPRY